MDCDRHTDCSENGYCNYGRCICYSNYTGNHCETPPGKYSKDSVIDSLLSMRLVLSIAIHYNLYNKKAHIHKDKIYRLK